MDESRSTIGPLSPPGVPGDAVIRHLLEQLPAGAYLCDKDGLITYFNQHAARLWGRAPRLNDPLDRFCGSFRLLSADGRPVQHDESWMALALRQNRAINGEEMIVERPDGSRAVVLTHVNPLHDESGALTGAVNLLVDITGRKSAENAGRVLASIVESSDDAIVSKDLNGRILTWNAGAERIFGYTADEAVGSPITLIIPPELHSEEQSILERLRRGERIEHFETCRIDKQGRRKAISLSVSPVRDGIGTIVGAAKVARDITVQKQAEAENARLYEQLCQADRRKDEFLAVLAHELRNPLAPLTNALHIMRLSDDLTPGVERLRDIMETQVQHLVRLVDDLLEVSRIAGGKIELRKKAVDLASIVRTAVETSRPLIDSAGHQLAIQVPPEPILLDADPVRLAQVVSNLLNNAAKYTDDGGQIWLMLGVEAGRAVLTVRDNGTGIAADMLPRVFDMFAQVEQARPQSRGGLGLGLTISRTLVELHGGTIEVHSDGPGRGCQFIVRLPTVAVNHDVGPAKSPTPDRPTLRQRRILVVDDTRVAVHTLGKLLEALGQQVSVAYDAAAALQTARAERPELVISDIGMPGMDGYELARQIRQAPELSAVVLVALTGYGQDSDRRRALASGFDAHLIKPVSVQALQELLESLPGPLDLVRPAPLASHRPV